MALNFTAQRPRPPVTFERIGDVLASGYFVVGGWNYSTVPPTWSEVAIRITNEVIAKTFLARPHVTVDKTQTVRIGGGGGVQATNMNKFYDSSLDDKLGGEMERLG